MHESQRFHHPLFILHYNINLTFFLFLTFTFLTLEEFVFIVFHTRFKNSYWVLCLYGCVFEVFFWTERNFFNVQTIPENLCTTNFLCFIRIINKFLANTHFGKFRISFFARFHCLKWCYLSTNTNKLCTKGYSRVIDSAINLHNPWMFFLQYI